MPSALLLVIFAAFLPYLSGPVGAASIHGLKIVAFAVVAHGVLGMLRSLCPDVQRIIIATVTMVLLLVAGSALLQLLVVAVGAVAGMLFCRDVKPDQETPLVVHHKTSHGALLLVIFAVLLIALPVLSATGDGYLRIADAFYRAGSLVFGGGHVVLPLLEESVVTPGWVSQDAFLAGYGAAQAVPGPMFSFAAYLGFFFSDNAAGIAGALVALTTIFLPGFLLVAGILPFWQRLSQQQKFAQAVAGINAVVVGILGAALYDPIFITAIRGPVDLSIGVIAFVLLAVLRFSALYVVGWCVMASFFTALIG
jgi:chromate transporter